MECGTFLSLVARVRAGREAKLSHSSAARQIAAVLTQFPDGVTESILLSAVRLGGGGKEEGATSLIATSRYVGPREVVEVTVQSQVDTNLLQLAIDDGVGGGGHVSQLHLLHAVSPRLLPLAGTPMLAAGRRLRLVGTAVAEVAASGDGALLLLPTPYLVLVAEPSFDHNLLGSATSYLRGQSLPPDAPVLLRLSRITAPESHAGRSLLRLLLCAPEATSEVAEVEAELILWDGDLLLASLLPERALLCLVDAELLTAGDAALGGAPAQLGHTERTILLHVDESPPAAAAAATALGGRLLRAAHANGGRGQDRGHATAQHEVEADAGCVCLGRLMEPPLVHVAGQVADVSMEEVAGEAEGAAAAALGAAADAAPAPEAAAPQLGDGGRGGARHAGGGSMIGGASGAAAPASVRLQMYDGHSLVFVELFEADGASGEARQLCDSLWAGHNLLLGGLSVAAGGGGDGAVPAPPAQPSPRHLHGWLQLSTAAAGGGAGGASVTNLSMLPAALRSPRLRQLGSSAGLVPAACWPPLEAAWQSGADAMCCVASMAGWTNTGGGGPLVTVFGSSRPHQESPGPLSYHAPAYAFARIRLRLGEGLFGEFEIECSASAAVLEQLLDASAAELSALPADEQRRRLDKRLYAEYAWALTREPNSGLEGGQHAWRVNQCAPLGAVCA